MTSEEALQKFGLPSSSGRRNEICQHLAEEIERERLEEGDQETLRTLSVQLFSIGMVEDSLLIWDAKNCNFDTMCGLDIQFLCGAGLIATKTFLATTVKSEAHKALTYLIKCEEAGDFKDWSPQKWIAYYRYYYHLDSKQPF
jgi:hypothetical protein